MKTKDKVILIGGFHELIELCEECNYKVIGIIDKRLEHEYLGYSVLGTDEDAIQLYKKYDKIPLIIGPDDSVLRKRLFDYYFKIGYEFTSLISPDAKISKRSKIGNGVVIQSGCNISSFSNIGNFVKLNTNANIMHDVTVGDFVTIAPNAVILGKVIINEHTYIGANSTILPEIQIGHDVTVGAGSVVTKDINNNMTVIGNPARKYEKK